jgi:hypothetical protein
MRPEVGILVCIVSRPPGPACGPVTRAKCVAADRHSVAGIGRGQSMKTSCWRKPQTSSAKRGPTNFGQASTWSASTARSTTMCWTGCTTLASRLSAFRCGPVCAVILLASATIDAVAVALLAAQLADLLTPCILTYFCPPLQDLRGLDQYFAMARGAPGAPALDMSKYFDTNYHYMVPELTDASIPSPNFKPFFDKVRFKRHVSAMYPCSASGHALAPTHLR